MGFPDPAAEDTNHTSERLLRSFMDDLATWPDPDEMDVMLGRHTAALNSSKSAIDVGKTTVPDVSPVEPKEGGYCASTHN